MGKASKKDLYTTPSITDELLGFDHNGNVKNIPIESINNLINKVTSAITNKFTLSSNIGLQGTFTTNSLDFDNVTTLVFNNIDGYGLNQLSYFELLDNNKEDLVFELREYGAEPNVYFSISNVDFTNSETTTITVSLFNNFKRNSFSLNKEYSVSLSASHKGSKIAEIEQFNVNIQKDVNTRLKTSSFQNLEESKKLISQENLGLIRAKSLTNTKGKYVLPSNFDFTFPVEESDIDYSNSVLEIINNYDFNDETKNFPNDITLKFNGSKLENGTITAINLKIEDTLEEILDSNVIFTNKLQIETIRPEWFGAKGNGADDTIAIQKMFDFMKNNNQQYNVTLTQQTYTVSAPINIHRECFGITISGKSLSNYDMSEIVSTNNTTHIIRSWAQGVTFSKIKFRYEGSKDNENAKAILLKMSDDTTLSGTDNDFYNNTDSVVEDCLFVNVHTCVEAWGRHVIIKGNFCSTMHRGFVFKQLNTEGLYGGAARAYKIYENHFHSSNPAIKEDHALIVNETENGYGFHICDNFSDSFNTFFKGDLLDSMVSNNQCYHMTGYGIYSGNINNSQITNNNFLQPQKYREGATTIPPFNMKGGIWNSGVIKDSIISGNSFGDCGRNIIKSEGVVNTQISLNRFSRWGIDGVNIYALLLDTSASPTSRSYKVNISSNTFSQRNPTLTYLLRTYTYHDSINLENDNIISTAKVTPSSADTIVKKYAYVNNYPIVNQGYIRKLVAGEDIGISTTDCFNETGIYVTVSGVLGTPFDAFKGSLEVQNINGIVTRKFNVLRSAIGSNVGAEWVQQISGTTAGDWRKVQTSAKGTVFPTLGVMVGESFYRTDLEKPFWYNGSVWKDATGNIV